MGRFSLGVCITSNSCWWFLVPWVQCGGICGGEEGVPVPALFWGAGAAGLPERCL